MNFPTYLVGGAVRDEIMGIEPKDKDFVVLAPSFGALREALIMDGCKIFVESPQYNTIRAKHPFLGAVDFVLARKDGIYKDGRHPESTEITTKLEEDLARRDFTCNAMAKDITTGEIIDPFSGRFDIERQMLCSVGDARARLREDRLRAYRALRFAVTKDFDISMPLSLAILELKSEDFESVSTERIREELYKMFKNNSARSAYILFREYPILGRVAMSRGLWLKPTIEQ